MQFNNLKFIREPMSLITKKCVVDLFLYLY